MVGYIKTRQEKNIIKKILNKIEINIQFLSLIKNYWKSLKKII